MFWEETKKIKIVQFMNNKIVRNLIVLSLVFFSFAPVAAHALYGSDCPIDSIDPKCLPPNLTNLQTMAVSLIGTLYVTAGTLFLLILIFNGFLYLIGYIEDVKYLFGASIEDAHKRMTQWLVGFLMIVISYPFINSMMQGIASDSECYKNLNNPTVQFIFPTVCKQTSTTTTTPTPTP